MYEEQTIQKTITKHKIKLEPEEQVLEIVENEKEEYFKGDPEFKNFSFLLKFYFVARYVLFFVAIFSAYYFMVLLREPKFITGYLIVVFIALLLDIKFSKVLKYVFKKGVTVFTDQSIITPTNHRIDWDKVYNLDIAGEKDNGYVVLDLNPMVNASHPKGNYLWNTQESEDQIFLGGVYEAPLLLEQLVTPWKKMGPAAKLEKIKQQLIKEYELLITDVKPLSETLESTNFPYRLTYEHNYSFPLKTIEIKIEFMEDIPAYFNVYPGNLMSIFNANEIKTGWKKLDAACVINSSHKDIIKQLFIREIATRFEAILKLAQIEISFGEPTKKFDFKLSSASTTDDETVLDSGLTGKNKTSEISQAIGNKHFILTLKPHDKIIHPDPISTLITYGFYIATHFAKGLYQIKK